MSISPVFECPDNLLERLPELCVRGRVRVEMVKGKDMEIAAHTHPYAIYCIFKGRLGRIHGRLSGEGKGRKMWLTFPRLYALNPLLWPVNFRLSKRIQKLLAESGARRRGW